jgi:hypothetical protein
LWLRDLIGSANRTRRRGAKRGRKPHDRNRARLELTCLEDRRVPAAITLIQNIGAVADATPGANTLSIPVNQPVAAGHRVIVEFYAVAGDPNTFPTVSDTAGNAYTLDNAINVWASSTTPSAQTDVIASALVSSPIPKDGAITVTFDKSWTPRAASAQEFYGLDASATPFRPLAWNFDFSTTASLPSYSIPWAPAMVLDSFGFAAWPGYSSDPTFTLNSGVTALASAGTTGANGYAATIAPGSSIATTTDSGPVGGTFQSKTVWIVLPAVYKGDPTTHFEIDAAPAPGEVLTVTVKALDASDNVDPGYTGTAHFTSSDLRATLPADATFTPADKGVKTFQVTLPDLGPQMITATDTVDGTIAGSTTVNVQPGPLTHFSVAAPAGATAGSPFSFTVTALDAFSNVATTYIGTVQLTSSDGQATLPPSYRFTSGTGGDDGVHTFTGVTLRTAGARTINVADTPTTSATGGASVAVSPGAAAAFDIAGVPSSITSGQAFSLTLTVRDAYGNVVPSFTGTVTFASSDKKAVLPANYTFKAADQGVHTFSVILKSAGTQSITLAEVGDPLLVDVVTILVTNPAGNGNKK